MKVVSYQRPPDRRDGIGALECNRLRSRGAASYALGAHTARKTDGEPMQDFTKLEVWRRALALAIEVDRLTRRFPRGGYGWLSAQARRAAASIGANIAEGCGQRSAREFARFLQIAAASASEAQHHLALARGLGLIAPRDETRLSDELGQLRRMLVALRNRSNESLMTDDSKLTADNSQLH